MTGVRNQLVARARPHRVLRIGVELPQLLAGLRLVAAHPAVALRGDDLQDAADRADRRRGPLPVQDAVLDRVVFPHQLAGVLVEGDDRRRACGDGMLTWLSSCPFDVLTIEQVAVDHRRRVRHVVRIRADLLHHVERPDDVGIGLAGELLVLERAVVLVVAEALDIEAESPRRDC